MAGNDDDERRPPQDEAPAAWDRIGQFWSDLASVSQGIAQRNQDLWSAVSESLRRPRYGADDLTSDVARAWTAAMQNMDDLWAVATRPPEREQVATALPTIFLRFRLTDGIWNVCDPVWIRVPAWDRKDLPLQAGVHLAGPDADGVAALRACIRVERRDAAYLLTTADVQGLRDGFYDGIITADDRPLASLRILVRSKDA